MRLLIAILSSLLVAQPVWAHRLHCDLKIVGDRLRVEAYYHGDTPAQDAKVSVHAGETLIAEGRTDETGVWTCPRPGPGVYIVRVEGVGHAVKETIQIPTDAVESPADSHGRTEKTGTQWGKLAIGLAIIVGLFGAWVLVRHTRRTA